MPHADQCRHRLSTIMNADRIVVVEHGELIEQGSHHELIAKQGRYADLWSKQVFLKPRQTSETVDIIDDRAEAADDSSSERTAADMYKGGTTDSDSEVFCAEQDRAQGESDTPQQRQEVCLHQLGACAPLTILIGLSRDPS